MQHDRSSPLENAGLLAGLVALPFVTYYLTISLVHYDGRLVVPTLDFLRHVAPPTSRTIALYAGWFALQAALMALVPGRRARGVALPDGRSLEYTLNGWRAFLITLVTAAALVATGVLPATLLADEIAPLLTTANVASFALCGYMLALGRAQATPDERRRGLLSAFFHGATLNPRTRDFDWKFFCESRPGMILWALIDLSLAAAQKQRFGAVTDSMILVCAFQIFYVADYFWNEEAILTTWDIRHESFGFMLCWGCLVWIPFTFSLQALYLSRHPVELSPWAAIALFLFNALGYWIFRTSNLQKHHFRGDPSRPIWGRTPEYIQTALGTRLLVSGWWRLARHANYLGDLMMGLAWCLATGFGSVVAYFYFIYFVILLVHRERRDFAHCAKKYGADWDEYARRVRWRIVPGLY